MIWTSAATGKVLYVGPEWTVFTGQAQHDALDDGWLAMVSEDQRAAVHAVFLDACSHAASFTMKYRLRKQNESYAWVVAGAAPAISPVDGRFLGFLGSVTEVEASVQDLYERRQIGLLKLPPPVSSTMPLTPMDIIADNVLLARATAERAGEPELFACLDLAISLIQGRLGSSSGHH